MQKYLFLAGQERYRAVTVTYYRNSAGILLVYDITSRESFEHIPYWVDEVKQYADANVVLMLVGNKTDWAHKRCVSTEEGKKYAQENGMFFIETSAESGENIDKAFEIIITGKVLNFSRNLFIFSLEIHTRHVNKPLENSQSAANIPSFAQRIDISKNAASGDQSDENGAKKGCCSVL